MKPLIKVSLFTAVALHAVACQQGSETEVSEPVPAEAPITPMVAGAETQLARVVHDTNLAFRQVGGAFVGSYATHRAQISAGAVTMTPYQWDDGQKVAGAAMTFKTRSVEVDGTNVLRAGAEQMDGTRVVLDRGGAQEILENREEGIEQSWRFASEPAGTGDLVVKVSVSNFEKAVATKTGVHFQNPGRLGFRYSNAVWTDSSGEAWDIPATWNGNEIVMTVPRGLIDASMFPAVLDPTIGSEAGVDTPVTGFTGAVARELSVSYSGSTWLAVWRDNRNDSADSDIFAARIAADGSVIDQFGIAVSTAAGNQTSPAVTFANGRWVVVWEANGDLAAATVTTTGAVTQLGPITTSPAVDSLPRIAAHGKDAVVVWQSDGDVMAARYTALAFGAPFAVASTANVEQTPTVAGNPAGGYLVAWSEGTSAQNVRGQLLDGTAAVTGASFDISAGAGAQISPAAAFDGTDFVVTFTNNNDIYGTRVSTAGVVLDTHLESMIAVGGKPISTAAGNQITSAVSCDPASCLVAWSDRRAVAMNGADIYGQRVDFTFALQGTEIVISNPLRQQISPAIAAGSSGWLVAWGDDRTGTSAALASRISGAGAVQDAAGIVLNKSRNAQIDPAFSRSNEFQLAVWSDSRAYGNDVMAVRYDAGGSKLDSTAVAVTTAANDQVTPAATFDGTQFLAVWDDGRNPTHDIYAGRFSTAGAALDGAGIPISTAANDQLLPDVASGGGVSLVVWEDRRNAATTGFDIYGAIVTAAGTVSVADIGICNQAGDQFRPAVVYDAADSVFVVVWSDVRNVGNADIYGARVTPAGAVLDPGGVLISGAANGQFSPDVAVSGSQLLAVWDDRRADTAGDIYGARLTASGSLSVVDANGIAISSVAGAQATPTALGMPGGSFVVIWADDRNAATTNTDIYGVQLDAAGVPATPDGYVISANTDDEGAPALQSDPNDQLRISVVYQRSRADLSAVRVVRRGITWEGAAGQTCSSDAACATGFCVDGYCCDTACGGSHNDTDCQACSVKRGAAVNGTCGIVTDNRICRVFDDPAFPFCDVRERCDGSSGPACPPDLGQHEGAACTGPNGAGTCPANDETGAPHVCE